MSKSSEPVDDRGHHGSGDEFLFPGDPSREAAMYEGGHGPIVKSVVSHYEMQPPLVVYYPGSSGDTSLTGIKGVDTVHVDNMLSDAEKVAFEALGAQAFRADAHEFNPPQVPDIICLINGSGLDNARVIARSGLRAGGLVVYSMHGGGMTEMMPDTVEIIAGASQTPDGALTIDDERPMDFITPKTYTELSEDELAYFNRQLSSLQKDYAEVISGGTTEEKFDQVAHNLHLQMLMSYRIPPKRPSFFTVFRKVADE